MSLLVSSSQALKRMKVCDSLRLEEPLYKDGYFFETLESQKDMVSQETKGGS